MLLGIRRTTLVAKMPRTTRMTRMTSRTWMTTSRMLPMSHLRRKQRLLPRQLQMQLLQLLLQLLQFLQLLPQFPQGLWQLLQLLLQLLMVKVWVEVLVLEPVWLKSMLLTLQVLWLRQWFLCQWAQFCLLCRFLYLCLRFPRLQGPLHQCICQGCRFSILGQGQMCQGQKQLHHQQFQAVPLLWLHKMDLIQKGRKSTEIWKMLVWSSKKKCSVQTGSFGSFSGSLAPHAWVGHGCRMHLAPHIFFEDFFKEALGSSYLRFSFLLISKFWLMDSWMKILKSWLFLSIFKIGYFMDSWNNPFVYDFFPSCFGSTSRFNS